MTTEQKTSPKIPLTEAEKRERRNRQRKAREEALRSLGLVKVKGALGGTYWE